MERSVMGRGVEKEERGEGSVWRERREVRGVCGERRVCCVKT